MYDPLCDPDIMGYCQPPLRPGTPNVSWGAEAFLDTPVINGTAYPTVTVQPKAYRFRILNAAHDRFWNLQLYKADPTITTGPGVGKEVKMVPALTTPGFPATWPADGREGGVPDPALMGPPMIQIGTEGGFLPRPVVIQNQPIAWNTDPTTFNFGNVSSHGMLLGPAERADVLVDFSQYAGQTLILYNDAPAAFPALDPRLDYYTGAPDNRDTGGVNTPLAGYGPNTRTLMQIKVAAGVGTPLIIANLNAAFNPAGTAQGVFQQSQQPIIVGQKMYNASATAAPVYKTPAGLPITFPNVWPNWGISRIEDTSLGFKTVETAAIPTSPGYTLPLLPKAIHDEMGAAYDEYGRMSAKLGIEMPFTTNLTQNFVIQAYQDPSTENIGPSLAGSVTPGDGTQLWKITHNGVDTHPVHFHLFDVQLVNRVGWDGAIRVPDDNELGWKDTIRISPLEDTIVAVRPVPPKLPFGIPDSIRPHNPALPLGSGEGFTNINTTNGQPLTPPILNTHVNFGWEYVWHCHILSHEEADMMRPVVLDMLASTPLPPAPTGLARSGSTVPIMLTWTDPTPVGLNPNAPLNLGNLANEIGFRILRATVTNGIPGAYVPIGTTLANATSFTDTPPSQSQTYSYKVAAYNARGDGVASNALTVGPAGTGPTRAAMLTPVPGTTLAGSAVMFTWNTGISVTQYHLEVGTTAVGSSNLFSLNTGTGLSQTVNNLPAGGVTVYVRLWSLVGGSWEFNDYVYTAAASSGKAAITSPAPSSVLTGASVTFAWNAGTATQYHLYVGTTGVGSSNVISVNTGTVLSQLVGGLPTNGSTVYVRLWSLVGGVWDFNDYTYTALTGAAGGGKAAMTSPIPGTALTGSSATFTWSAGTATQYHLEVGTTAVGSNNVFSANTGTVLSQLVAGLPTNGSTVYVRLWSLVGGLWDFNDYTYTAAAASGKGAMTSPTPGTTLSGAVVTFTWSAGTATQYHLYAGTTGVGSSNVFSLNTGTALTQLVGNLPTDGSTVYVRLWSLVNGVWEFNDYTYTAAAASGKAAMTSPVAGSVLPGASVTFTWDAGTATQYHLYVGTTGAGSSNIFSFNTGTALTQLVGGIPTNGSTVYVRLWSLVGGVWQFNDYTYTAATI